MRIALKILSIQASLLVLQASEAFAAKSAVEDAASGKSSVGMPQLDPEWFASQIFWLVITFVSLYVIFGKKILPEICGILEARREHINEDLSTAQALKEEAESVQAAYEEALLEAQNKSTDLFGAVSDKIKAKTIKKQADFQERSMNDIRETEEAIEKATAQAMDEMTTIAAEVAAQAAEKIVGISTDMKKAKDVVRNINKKAA